MELYIVLAILAYLCFAVAGVGDKFILAKAIKHPYAYAFYIGLFSPIIFVLAPFGLHLLPWNQLSIAFAGGASFTYAVLFLYRAIEKSGPSRVIPIISGIQPVFVLILAFFIVDERLTNFQFLAYVLMVVGSIFISLEKSGGKWSPKSLGNAAVSAFMFALAFTLFKYTYTHTNFISGLLWTRLGLFLGAMSFLLFKSSRDVILADFRTKKPASSKLAFLGNFSLGATGAFLQNYAIALGSASIVSAMGGLQLAFVVILSWILSKHLPDVFNDDSSLSALMQKIFAILLIALGIILVNL